MPRIIIGLRALGTAAPDAVLAAISLLLSANGFASAAELDGVVEEELDGFDELDEPGRRTLRQLCRRAECRAGWRTSRAAPRRMRAVRSAGASRSAGSQAAVAAPSPAIARRRSRSAERGFAVDRCPLERALAVTGVGQAVVPPRDRGPAGGPGPQALCKGRGPRAAHALLASELRTDTERAAWIERERCRALLQPCAKSLGSVRSGIRCWAGYCRTALQLSGLLIPPTLASLLSWSALFRSEGTFSNYLSAVKLACMLQCTSVEVFAAPELRRAKVAIRKRRLFRPRPKMFLRLDIVDQLLDLEDPEGADFGQLALLGLLAYVFLLRVPSEGLPCIWSGDRPFHAAHSSLYLADGKLCLRLACRKNAPEPTTLVRGCWCSSERSCTCPVHVLAPRAERAARGVGGRLFPELTAAGALATLRRALGILRVPDARLYRTHDFRRGHAQASREPARRASLLHRARRVRRIWWRAVPRWWRFCERAIGSHPHFSPTWTSRR